MFFLAVQIYVLVCNLVPHQGLLKKDEFVKEKNLWENFVAEIYFVNKCVSLTPPVSLSHQLLKYSADWKTVSEPSQQKTINKCYFHKILRRNVFLSRLLLYSQPNSAFTVLSEPCNFLTVKTVEKKKDANCCFHTIPVKKRLCRTPPVSSVTAHPIRHLWPWQTDGRLQRHG